MIYVEGGPIWLFWLIRLIEIAALIFMTVMWCLSMERALRACDYTSRKLQIGQSYLIFIPLFGFVWQFIAVNKVSTSLATEYHFRGWKSDEGRPAIETGLIACVVVVVVFLVRFFIPDFNPGLAFLTTLAICICMYMHRERLNAFTERLEEDNRKVQQQSFAFDAVPNPFAYHPYGQQSFSQQSFSQQSFSQQSFSQQSLSQQSHSQQSYGQQPWQKPPVVKPAEQYANQQREKQQQQAQREQQEAQRAGWDGVTAWLPPDGWKHPDLSDPSPYFS